MEAIEIMIIINVNHIAPLKTVFLSKSGNSRRQYYRIKHSTVRPNIKKCSLR